MVKRIDGLISKEAEFIHNPFVPVEVRDGDLVKAQVSFDSGVSWAEARVWRYSPFGIEIVADRIKFERGKALDLRLAAARDETIFSGLVVADAYTEQGTSLVGIRLFTRPSGENVDSEKRETVRWRCSDAFLPTGSAANPIKFNDYIFFRVEDVSASGMKIVTSMRNKFLVRGQRLEATMSVPCVGSVQCNFEIVRIDYSNTNQREFIILGVEFLKRDDLLLKSIAEYLLQFGEGVSVQTLAKDGFPLSDAYKAFDFSYVKTKEEYDSVLDLRFRAYSAAGKAKANAGVQDMGDEFDARSRILVVKHQGKIVGSVRVIFSEDADTLSYGRYFDVAPEGLPPRSEYAEASRMCIDPEYRSGADIFYHLAEHMVITAVKSGRRYIVGGATEQLLPKWGKCGFSKIGINYTSKDIAGIRHELILMDTHKVALGRGIDLKLWNRVFSRMVNYMLENRIIAPTPFDLIRINGIRALSKVGFY